MHYGGKIYLKDTSLYKYILKKQKVKKKGNVSQETSDIYAMEGCMLDALGIM